MRMWIVVVNFNGLEDTRKCLRSLAVFAPEHASVVLVDNASDDDPQPIIRREFPWCVTIRNAVNGGWAGGNNTGIQYALSHHADIVVLLNNDTVVATDFVKSMAQGFELYPEFGIVGPVIRYLDPPHEVMTDGVIFNRLAYPGFFERKPIALNRNAQPAVEAVDIVNGCCMAVRREVFAKIGMIDERFFLIHEESDFCLRALRAGFRLGVLNEALVWHKGSSAFARSGKRLQRYYDTRNLFLLLSKHASAGLNGRGSLRSLWEYWKYCFYRYAIEREQGQIAAADAVLEGLCDAAARRFGAYRSRRHFALPILRGMFEAWRGVRSNHRQEAQPSALALY